MDKIDLTCPQCGGTMEHDAGRETLHCPFCGYGAVLQRTDPGSIREKAYARQKGILQANAEAEKAKKRSKRRGALIAFGVILALVLAALAYNALQPKTDPFEFIRMSFTGTTGEGTAEVVILPNAGGDVDPHKITYRVEPRHYLSEGDVVTVTAESGDYALSPTKKTYVVTGLDTYLADLNALSEKAVEMIHNKSDITVDRAVTGAGITITPAKTEPSVMYLTTDGQGGNTLYDVYRAQYSEKDGGFAERYVVIYYTDIIVRDSGTPTMSYRDTMYTGQIIETLDDGYGGYMTGYKSLKDVKADILAHQSSAVELQEREP